MFGIYGVALTLCCIGIAHQYKRNDRRFLIAIVTPWVLFFAFCPHLHERYLVYAAAAASLFVAYSLGMAGMSIFISLVSFIMTISVQFAINGGRTNEFLPQIDPNFGSDLYRWIRASHPGIAWAVVLCALTLLYLSLAPSRRVREDQAEIIVDQTDREPKREPIAEVRIEEPAPQVPQAELNPA
jgi:hypothetical protein